MKLDWTMVLKLVFALVSKTFNKSNLNVTKREEN